VYEGAARDPAMPLPVRTAVEILCSGREMGGDRATSPVGGWPCSRPSNELHHGLAANPLPSPSRQPSSPSHTQTTQPVKGAAQASGLQDGGVGWPFLGTGLDDPRTPPQTEAAAPASGLPGGGGGVWGLGFLDGEPNSAEWLG